jgi:WD40 repeat protein
VTPDDRHVVVGAGSSLLIWDAESGAVHREPGRVTTIEFDAADRFVTGSSALDIGRQGQDVLDANALSVWSTADGQSIGMLRGHPCGVNAIAVQGRLVASAPNPGLYAYQDPGPRVWDISTGEELHHLTGHTHTVTAVAITPDERRVLTGGGNCFQRSSPEFTLKIWDAGTGQLAKSLETHRGPVVGIRVTPDGRWAVSAGGACPHAPQDYDGSIRVWDLAQEALAATFQADDAMTCLLMPDPTTIVAGSADGAVHILRVIH